MRRHINMPETDKIIDIEKEFKTSNSQFLRSLPPFVIRMIEKLIRQDEMNETIYHNRDKTGVPFVRDVLKYWNVSVNVHGRERLPENGRFVFAANHPVGGIDALSFFSVVGSIYPAIISPSNELLNIIPNIRPLLLGLNVFGRNSRDTAGELNRLFESDKQILIFPAGEVSRRTNGSISDITWQKSFITKAIQYKRDVVPVFISGRNSNLFYNVARIRKMLGIKMYIETILLPREMMKQHNSTVSIVFGNIVPYQTFTRELTHHEWAQYVKDEVYKLSENLKQT
ncbi:MAG TPA: 1-acyl-sn-glycerol-3-phosphate acyltransferase [Bacteroidales bacterium]|nr:1-acyl-sn-glycerol-3-phosphate acyltransferase [Bacteroidales bacterium]